MHSRNSKYLNIVKTFNISDQKLKTPHIWQTQSWTPMIVRTADLTFVQFYREDKPKRVMAERAEKCRKEKKKKGAQARAAALTSLSNGGDSRTWENFKQWWRIWKSPQDVVRLKPYAENFGLCSDKTHLHLSSNSTFPHPPAPLPAFQPLPPHFESRPIHAVLHTAVF